MCYEMMSPAIAPCPHLKGAQSGALCLFSGEPIRHMEFATVKLCLSRKHESCGYYRASLRRHAVYASAGA